MTQVDSLVDLSQESTAASLVKHLYWIELYTQIHVPSGPQGGPLFGNRVITDVIKDGVIRR